MVKELIMNIRFTLYLCMTYLSKFNKLSFLDPERMEHWLKE